MIRTELLKYFADMRVYYEGYHTHKEVSAWAAIALQVVFVFGVLQGLSDWSDTISRFAQVVVTHLIAVFSIMMLWYVFIQSQLQRTASDYVSACHQLEAELLNTKDSDFRPDNYPLRLDSSAADRVLPEILRQRAAEFRKSRCSCGRWLDWLRYLAVLIIGATAIIEVWLL